MRFILGFDANPKLVALAEGLAPSAWQRLERMPKYKILTEPRAKGWYPSVRVGSATTVFGKGGSREFSLAPIRHQPEIAWATRSISTTYLNPSQAISAKNQFSTFSTVRKSRAVRPACSPEFQSRGAQPTPKTGGLVY